jgi:hypothetical protein
LRRRRQIQSADSAESTACSCTSYSKSKSRDRSIQFPRLLRPRVLSHPHAMQKIVDRHVDESRVCAVQKALDQSHEKTTLSEPFEARQYLIEQRVHVHTRWREHPVDDTKQTRKCGPDRQRLRHDSYYSTYRHLYLGTAIPQSMSVVRTLTRRGLHTVLSCGVDIIMVTAVSTVPSMSAVTEQMHGDHSDEEQYPDPVL